MLSHNWIALRLIYAVEAIILNLHFISIDNLNVDKIFDLASLFSA